MPHVRGKKKSDKRGANFFFFLLLLVIIWLTQKQHSDYSAKVFGFATFGKVYGLIICLAGLLNFSQSALDAATHKVFHNNPVPVNVILLSLALLVGMALVAYVATKSRAIKSLSLDQDAGEASESLIPRAPAGYGGVNGWAEEDEDRGRRM